MTDITTTLSHTQATLATLQQAAATAAAGGAAQTQAAEAAWRAIAEVEAAKARAEGLRDQLLARGDKLTLALAARMAVLAEAERNRTEGTSPPLADASAATLATTVAAAAGVTKATLDSQAPDAVKGVDDANAALDDTAVSELAAAEADLLAKQDALAAKQAAADAALAAAEAAPAQLAQVLSRALVRREDALRLAVPAAAAGPAAAVAYADYQAARKVLNDAKAAAAATALTDAWTTARDQALSAVADLLAAQALFSQRRLALETKRAEQAAKSATRDAEAAAAVTAALAPPPPPPPPGP